MVRTALIALLVSLCVGACSEEPIAARDAIQRQLTTTRPAPLAAERAGDPMLAIRGRWIVDYEATLRENDFESKELLDHLRQDMIDHKTFDVQITRQEYISRSRFYTRADRYTVMAVQGDVVIIKLESMSGATEDHVRTARLWISGDHLMISTGGALEMVFSRPSEGQ